MWDTFISHASEDKDLVVRPLAELLRERGLEVWYDEYELSVGDNLREKIDQGLAKCRFGVVVLSPAFFSKGWPRWELDGLVTRHVNEGSVLLPVWHGVSQQVVSEYSPSLANIFALNSSVGTWALADDLERRIRRSDTTAATSFLHVHRNEAVRIVNLPRVGHGVIENHYFYNCDLVGPGVLVFLGEMAMVHSQLSLGSFIPLYPEEEYQGLLPIAKSRIESCRLFDVGLGVIDERAAPRSTIMDGFDVDTETGMFSSKKPAGPSVQK